MFDNRKLLLMVSASILSFAATPAMAQDSAGGTAAESGTSEIVVTGSRIARRDFEAASPIVTLGSDAVSATGSVTLEGALNQLPQFSAGSTAFSNELNATGQATLNLRGLGAQRNLVLLDGRRLQPSNSSQVIDINTIPTILVGGTEIISGGASAVYGSDAISGVVNFKLRQLNGVEISGQNTLTEHGDGGIREVSIGAGTRFADGRGQIIVGAAYTDRDAININNRAFFRENRGVSGTIPFGMFTPGANLPSQAAMNDAFAAYGVAAGTVLPSSSIGINPDGTLFSSGRGVHNYRGNLSVLYNNGQALLQVPELTYTQIPLERISTFGRATFEATDNIKLFVQGLYTDYTSVTIQDAAPNAGLWTLRVPRSNPFIPAALNPLLDSRANPTAPVVITKRYSEAGPRKVDHEATTWQVLGGASGSFGGSGITWELYGSTGKSVVDDISYGSVFANKAQQLVAAADGGASLCAGGYNPFSPTNSPECAAYISGVTTNRTETKQDVVELNFQGAIAQLPAGELRFAVGAGYRRNEFAFTPDPQQVTGNIVAIARTSPTAGSTSAKEIYAELLIPVLSDLPAIRELTIDAAYRYSDYKRSGGVSTYKVDVDWTVVNGVRLRGGYQRAIRAPNVGELYTATTGVFPTIGVAPAAGDPCDLRSTFRAGANEAKVRDICLSQGMLGPIYDNFRTDVSQVGPETRKGGHLDGRRRPLAACRDAMAVEPARVGRLLQYRDRRRDRSYSRAGDAQQMLQRRRQQPELRRQQFLLQTDRSRRNVGRDHQRAATLSEPGRLQDGGRRRADRLVGPPGGYRRGRRVGPLRHLVGDQLSRQVRDPEPAGLALPGFRSHHRLGNHSAPLAGDDVLHLRHRYDERAAALALCRRDDGFVESDERRQHDAWGQGL
jgi:outer membrane receptor protein involved in Fe transport